MKKESDNDTKTKNINKLSFQPIEIPEYVLKSDLFLVFQDELRQGYLKKYELGYKGENICSRFLTHDGIEDELTSGVKGDDDFLDLMKAHMFRYANLLGILNPKKRKGKKVRRKNK